MSLRADPVASVGVRSGTTLAALGLPQGRKGGFGSWTVYLFGSAWGGLVRDAWNKFGLILKYQLPGNCHQSN